MQTVLINYSFNKQEMQWLYNKSHVFWTHYADRLATVSHVQIW